MKNKAFDVNDLLIEQLEWLGDRGIKGEELDEEVKRAEAACKVAEQIIANNNLMLRAAIAADQAGGKMKLPLLIKE